MFLCKNLLPVAKLVKFLNEDDFHLYLDQFTLRVWTRQKHTKTHIRTAEKKRTTRKENKFPMMGLLYNFSSQSIWFFLWETEKNVFIIRIVVRKFVVVQSYSFRIHTTSLSRLRQNQKKERKNVNRPTESGRQIFIHSVFMCARLCVPISIDRIFGMHKLPCHFSFLLCASALRETCVCTFLE